MSASTTSVEVIDPSVETITPPLIDELQQACGPLAEEVRKSLGQFDADTLLHKNHTLLVLGLDAAYRDQVMLGQLKSDLSDDQLCVAGRIVDRYERQFDQLLACRTALLQSPTDPQKVNELLRFNRIATVLLTRKVHQRIFIEVLTREQKTEIAARRTSSGKITR
ncbi:MAG: hypothetical protein ACR2NP_23035 [Pirellulaceae bacterium]